jgi:hypothetical protein
VHAACARAPSRGWHATAGCCCQRCRSLGLDTQAVIAAVTPPFNNGRTESVNTKTKMIKRQEYGRVSVPATPSAR